MIRKKCYELVKKHLEVLKKDEFDNVKERTKTLYFDVFPDFVPFLCIFPTAEFEVIVHKGLFYNSTYELNIISMDGVKKRKRKYMVAYINEWFSKFVNEEMRKEVDLKLNTMHNLVQKAIRDE